ncbi:MAG: alanine dehydrogenase [Gammaproteobacteria bacterium]|nr:alanine dehydrogenase [Gammaproteobacteria bacterium]
MRIGIPKETKVLEGRIGLVPEACSDLVAQGHQVFVQKGGGLLSGYTDEQYRAVGVQIIKEAAELFDTAEMIVKVKEPYGPELDLLKKDHLLFCYLHLAANAELTKSLQKTGLLAVAFETVVEDGALPLLAPMSDIAGRLAGQIGSNLLYQHNLGRGILLGGVPAAERGHVVVLGGGVAGGGATHVVASLGAEVTVFDKNRTKLEQMRAIGNNVTALYPYASAVQKAVAEADLLIGAVLIPGAKATHVVSAEMVRTMKPNSVIIDISVDQGGCVETTRPTTYADPTFMWEQVLHFGVTNMPGAVPRTASQSLSAALVPFVSQLASGDWEQDERLQSGINVRAGEIVNPSVAQALA